VQSEHCVVLIEAEPKLSQVDFAYIHRQKYTSRKTNVGGDPKVQGLVL